MKKIEIISYGSLGFSKDLIMYFFSGMIMLYLTDALHISPIIVGTILFIGRILDIIYDIFIANFIENSKINLKTWFILAFGTGIPLFLILFTLNQNIPKSWLIILVSLLYFSIGAIFTIMDISFWSMIPMLGQTKSSQSQLSSIATVMTSSAALVCFSLVIPLLHLLGKNNLKLGFSLLSTFLALFIIVIISCVIPFLPKSYLISSKNTFQVNLFRKISLILKDNIFLRYSLYFFFFQISFEWMNTYNIYYFKYSINQEYFFSIYAFTILSQMLGAYTYRFLNQFITKKLLFSLSAILSISGMIGLFLCGQLIPENVVLMFFAATIKQFGSGLFLASATYELSATIHKHHETSGHFNPALFTSAKLLISKLANALASFGLGFGLYSAKYIPNQVQSLSTTKQIAYQAFFIPIIYILISSLFYHYYQKSIHCSRS